MLKTRHFPAVVSRETFVDATICRMAEKTEKQKIGRLGEDIAVKYLENKGFLVIEQNYLRKCGEIDIIAEKGGFLHFIEVKSVSELANSRPGRSERSDDLGSDISRVTSNYRAEDNLHPYKLKRLSRTIQLYLYEKRTKIDEKWFFDAIVVEIDIKNKAANVRFLENLIL